MADVVAEISASLDGFVAGPNATLEQPLGVGGEKLHEWVVRLKTFRDLHGMERGDIDSDDELLAESVRATGAIVMGRRMFSGGEGPWEDDPNADGWWGDDPPFHKPVYVVTHHEREPLVKEDTTFTFVTDGVERAIEQARAAAGEKVVGIGGGAKVIQQALELGLLDELRIHLVPLLLGGGVRLFENVSPLDLERTGLADSPTGVIHLRFRRRE
ncbi:MAG TPA: dihydrofolate reductase family protein [Gaiellaceae bacterium]|nr:dihydrofolate reductase family protein [Gaiellaceae bacterium]